MVSTSLPAGRDHRSRSTDRDDQAGPRACASWARRLRPNSGRLGWLGSRLPRQYGLMIADAADQGPMPAAFLAATRNR